MRVSDITKQAADIVNKYTAAENAIKERYTAATAKLAELEAQAEQLAKERKFDEYADNMENQRKQQDIIDLVKKISRLTPEQREEGNKVAREFYDKAQQAFDEDTAKDLKELEDIINKADTVAQRIFEKYNATNEAVRKVSTACHSSTTYGGVSAPMSIPNGVRSVVGMFENLRKAQKEGKRLW